MAEKALGRRPPKDAPAVRFRAVREAAGTALPAHPSSVDLATGLSDWKILHNDSWGCCVVVTYYTLRRIAAHLVGKDEYPPDDAEFLALYRTQNPTFDPNSSTHGPGSDADGGMDIQTLLELLHKEGWQGVKVVAFAKVDHTDLEEVKAALGGIPCATWIGLNCSQANQEEFDAGRPWTITGPVEGGHSTTGTGYDPQYVSMETWAEITRLAPSYVTSGGTSTKTGVEEMWVVIFEEHAALLTQAQRDALNTAYKAITGGDIAWPSDPAPTPDPFPPAPVDPQAAFVAQAEAWVALRHSSKANTQFEKDVQAYLDYLAVQ